MSALNCDTYRVNCVCGRTIYTLCPLRCISMHCPIHCIIIHFDRVLTKITAFRKLQKNLKNDVKHI